MDETSKRKAMAVLAGVLIVVAVVALCVAKKKTSPPKLKTVAMFLMCEREACGHIFFGKKIKVNREPPYECEKCGHKSAYQVVVCNRCNAYVPKKKPRLEDNVCPYCKQGDALGLVRGSPLARPPDAAE